MSEAAHIGQRLSYNGALCTVRYIGHVAGTDGEWLGVEWDDGSRGKHNGQHKGFHYFECLSKSPTAASFLRPSRQADKPQSFLAAIREKYVHEDYLDNGEAQLRSDPQIEIVYFGKKPAEEVGFDKIRDQLARLEELRIVILDGMRISWDVAFEDGGKGIKEISPLIVELDLSRNLFENFGTVGRICRELDGLAKLRLNGNRFQLIHDQEEEAARDSIKQNAFLGVKELELEENLLSWEGLSEIASNFPQLQTFSASLNQLSCLAAVDPGTMRTTLTSLTLEYNDFTSLSDLNPLSSLENLQSLHLKGNSIATVRPSLDVLPPLFPASLTYLDVSYNAVASWEFIDSLPTSVPGLTALRFSHNPIYENPDLKGNSKPSSAQQSATSEEAHMIAVARLPSLKSLNFSSITAQDRTNAELFYLSRIAKQLSSVPENEEAEILTQHPQYPQLCETYGEPDIIRRDEINPNFLEARLIKVRFQLGHGPKSAGNATTSVINTDVGMQTATTEIPRSFDVYAVKGIVGRLFHVAPLSVRLIWETGEWDPVGGFDEEISDSSSGEEDETLQAELKLEAQAAEAAAASRMVKAGEHNKHGEPTALRNGGQWVKREVELTDGPRQLGFCVDGLEAAIRVEIR